MILSHYHRFVFIHIPKTAGTSVADVFDRLCPDLLPTPLAVPRASALPDTYLWNHAWRHAPASEVRRELGAEEWGRLFSFAFVRNPWARALSWYHMLVHKPRAWMPEPARDFAEFLSSLSHQDFPDQVHYLTGESGEQIVDFVGRVETMKQDFNTVIERLGLDIRRRALRAPLRHHNPSPYRVDYHELYTPAMRQVIAEHSCRDIAAFGYEF